MTSRAEPRKSRRTRKTPEERRAEIVSAACRMAMEDGLGTLSLRSVADDLGITGGLVGHYFPSVDELLAEVFRTIAAAEVDKIFYDVGASDGPLEGMRAFMRHLLSDERDRISLLWIDGWNAGRKRPLLMAEVVRQARAWLDRVAALIEDGRATGVFRTADPVANAMRILAVFDGLSIKAVMGTTIDYRTVKDLVPQIAEQELGLATGTLA
ncbi:TetR/AcrR family transcriptional regulator [Nonomuraea sp. NPDC050536]|uniref:TetR/AcrR family transcriptional regulator n=1 Tax=Nonomuraea sp. NPDC050536 TaxID=3364366 RepID=UPI0037C53BC0